MKNTWLTRLKNGLVKTRENTMARIVSVVKRRGKLDRETLESVEESLLMADVGVSITTELVDGLAEKAKQEHRDDVDFVMDYLRSQIIQIAGTSDFGYMEINSKPWVVLVMGVNGVGKTTTIGKMAHKYAGRNKKVLLAAGDTFRAAAGEQLELWAKRSNVGIIRHQDGADPASVVFDSVNASKARDIDVLLIDTAGRLHTKSNLMEELKKIDRVLKKENRSYPHETLLVLDATTGQNALQQAKAFNEAVKCTGIVVTKLDGTAKGGMILSIQKELGIPVKMVGVGEGVDDLNPFDAKEYAQALFEI